MSLLSKKKKYNIRIIKNYTSYNFEEDTPAKYRVIKSQLNNTKNIDFFNINNNNKINEIIHPITLSTINTENKPLCLTKFNYKNNKIEFISNYKCNNNEDKYKDFLYIPPISLSYLDILKIYDIYDIESLYEWLKKYIDIYYVNNTIIRVLTCWLKINFNDIKKYIKYLTDIVNIYINKIIENTTDTPIKNITINEITKKILEWYSKNSDFIESDDKTFDNIIKYILL
jgi:hypothetical protein